MAIYRSKMQYDPAVISDLEEFQYFVEKKLKGDLIDAIFSNAEKGEIILHIGTPYSTHIPEMMLTEERIDMTMMDLVRCKDCKYAYITNDGECKYCDIWFPVEAKYLDGDYYCASAERKES